MTKKDISNRFKTLWERFISFSKRNKFSYIFTFLVFIIVGSLTTVLDSDYGLQNLSSSLKRTKNYYQVSQPVDKDNLEQARECIKKFASSLGLSYQTMNIEKQPLSYLFIDAKNNENDGLVLEGKALSAINFSVYGLEHHVEDKKEFDTLGNTDLRALFRTNASNHSGASAIYISTKFADELISSGVASSYESLLGREFESTGECAYFFQTVYISNIFDSSFGRAKNLTNLYGDFVVCSRFLYASRPCRNMNVGVLLDRGEYTNKEMIKSFVDMFPSIYDISVKVEHENQYNQKYSGMLKDYLKNSISQRITQIVLLSISTTVIIIEIIYLLFKRKIKEIITTNVLSVIVTFLVVLFIFSIIKLIFRYLLFGTLGIVFIAVFCINISSIYALIER